MKKIKMTNDDANKWLNYKNNYKVQPTDDQIDLIVQLHAKYFNHNEYYPCTCTPKTWNQWIAQLDTVYNETRNSTQT
tara:strand:+ start:33 stop:263 length:231 start_codon:yes stop_codon:yes gene_type:complete